MNGAMIILGEEIRRRQYLEMHRQHQSRTIGLGSAIQNGNTKAGCSSDKASYTVGLDIICNLSAWIVAVKINDHVRGSYSTFTNPRI